MMPSPLFPLSFSRLSAFEQCEAKFDYVYVSKTAKDMGSEHSLYGDRVHSALEVYGKTGQAPTGADEEFQRFIPLVDVVLSQDGTKYFEQQIAIRRDKLPCDWFSPEVWLRSILDVLVIDGNCATVLDWKTGKVKENPLQLKLFAAMVFAHFPEVDTVRTCYVWLAHNEVTDVIYHRIAENQMWAAIEPRLVKVQETIDLGVFKTKPSGLCPWCPAKGICPDARLRK